MKKIVTKTRMGIFALLGTLGFFAQTTQAQSFTQNFDDINTLVDWYVTNNSDLASPTFGWGVGNPATFAAQAGATNSYLSCNYQSTTSTAATGATISNWLFTPSRVFNNGDVITFYTRKPSAAFPDRMQVRLSTAGPGTNVGTTSASVGDFTTLLLDINPTLTTTGYPITWTQYSITISGLAGPTSGRIAFRYFVANAGTNGTNSDYIGLDTYTYTSTLPAPGNDNCSTAATLIHAATCTPTAGSTLGATPSVPTLACGDGTANDDVWYQFVATSTSAAITVDGSTNFDAVFEVSSGACGAGTVLTCVDNTVADGVEYAQLNNLTIGQTYYIRVYDWDETWPITLGFTICVQQITQCTLTQPAGSITETETCGADLNGACTTPQALTCGNVVWGKTWTSPTARDVDWYTFTVTNPASVSLAVQSEVPVNVIFLNIANCASPVQLATLAVNNCTGGTLTYNFTTAGTYAAVIIPQVFGGYACATNNDYIATLSMGATAPVVTAGGPTSFCTGGSVTLTSTGTAPFTWYNGASVIPSATTATYVATGAGNYTSSTTNGNGCTTTSNIVSVTVNPLDNATFAYGSSAYCIGTANPTPTASAAGTYSATPAGLNFVSSTTGQINLATSGAGTYTITHTTTGTCPNTSTQSVTVNALPVVGVAPVAVCAGSPAFTLSNGTPAGGTYSGTGVSAGQFNPASGTQTITYSYTNGNGCTASNTGTITVNPLDNAGFNYGGSTFCSGAANPVPTASAAGTFSATPAGLNFVSTSTGEINMTTSGNGSYTITHTTTGTCPNTASQTLTITAAPSAAFTYTNSSYCQGSANPTPTFTGSATAGTFSATPAGLLFVNTSTGEINLATSTPGTYTVTNSIAASGSCSATSATYSVTVKAKPTATVSGGGAICAGSGNQVNNSVALTGTGPWTILVSNGTSTFPIPGIAASPQTFPAGEADAGTYTVVSVSDATGCSNVGTGSATVSVNPLPTVAVAPVAVCTGSPAFALSNGTPAGGSYSGTGVSAGQFDPAAGTQTVTYSYTDGNGCTATNTGTVTVNAKPTATVSGGGAICAGGTGSVTITLTGTSPWSLQLNDGTSTTPVTGITNSNFSVPVSTAGTYTVVSVTDALCSNTGTGSATVTVTAAPTVNIVADQTLCSGGTTTAVSFSGPVVGTTYAWTNNQTGIGLAATGNGNIASFTASNTGATPLVATVTVTPTANGCPGTPATFTITVNANPAVTYSTLPTLVCVYGSNITLSGGTPAGGTYSGTGVTGTTFSPSTAGVGNQTVTYSYTDANSCPGMATANIEVSQCLGVEDLSVNGTLSVYPNPAGNQVTFGFSNTNVTEMRISILSLDGKTVYQNQFQGNQATVNVNELARGTYFVRIQAQGKETVTKLVLN